MDDVPPRLRGGVQADLGGRAMVVLGYEAAES